jgi:hypothetical protein
MPRELSCRTFMGGAATDQGWNDVGVTPDGHADYARRFAGHLQNGEPSLTG